MDERRDCLSSFDFIEILLFSPKDQPTESEAGEFPSGNHCRCRGNPGLYYVNSGKRSPESNGKRRCPEDADFSSFIFYVDGLDVYTADYLRCLYYYFDSLSGLHTLYERKRSEVKGNEGVGHFYLRIIGVFFGVWVPSMLCSDYSHSKNNYLVSLLAILVIAMQPILTFCAILTKSDARKYIYDLVTLSYLFGDCTTRREKDKTYEGDNRFSSTTHENDNNRLSIDLKEILDLGDDASESNNTEEQFRIIDSDATTPNVVAGADSGTNALEIISNNSWNGDVVSEQANNGRDVDLDDIEHPDILHPPVMEEVSN